MPLPDAAFVHGPTPCLLAQTEESRSTGSRAAAALPDDVSVFCLIPHLACTEREVSDGPGVGPSLDFLTTPLSIVLFPCLLVQKEKFLMDQGQGRRRTATTDAAKKDEAVAKRFFAALVLHDLIQVRSGRGLREEVVFAVFINDASVQVPLDAMLARQGGGSQSMQGTGRGSAPTSIWKRGALNLWNLGAASCRCRQRSGDSCALYALGVQVIAVCSYSPNVRPLSAACLPVPAGGACGRDLTEVRAGQGPAAEHAGASCKVSGPLSRQTPIRVPAKAHLGRGGSCPGCGVVQGSRQNAQAAEAQKPASALQGAQVAVAPMAHRALQGAQVAMALATHEGLPGEQATRPRRFGWVQVQRWR